ncbi:histone H1 [Bacteroides fragilis]|uniref:histone H1 n=1 Tax=Bacteroides TaxID=816 RepID=UPI00202FAB7F|nr:histone H1 [Bacteroides fragilis]MCM0340267.1 histone H1 [Bacteroides fragilis]
MEELIEKINAVTKEFMKNANAQVENNNKAAGMRARKASLELEKMMKEFRKVSLDASKN